MCRCADVSIQANFEINTHSFYFLERDTVTIFIASKMLGIIYPIPNCIKFWVLPILILVNINGSPIFH
jgi:hypothetical protein